MLIAKKFRDEIGNFANWSPGLNPGFIIYINSKHELVPDLKPNIDFFMCSHPASSQVGLITM